MASLIELVPDDGSVSPLVLSDADGPIWLDRSQDELLPLPALEETYAESSDTEGGVRTHYRPHNPVGQGRVYIGGESASEFRVNVARWQETVNSVNSRGGSIVYQPESGETVTYEIRSMAITSLPQDGVWIPQKVASSDFTATFAPYGRLPELSIFTNVEASSPVATFGIGDRSYEALIKSDTPSLYWRLGVGGAQDSSGNGRVGTGNGGISAGGVEGALLNDSDKATSFDGVDDFISSGYSVYTVGSTRTFEGWAYRANSSANHTLFGGSGTGNPVYLRVDSGSQNVTFSPNNSVAVAWSEAWPGNTQWAYWALIFDDGNNLVELFINGVSKGVKAMTGTYSSPGTFRIGITGATGAPFNGRMDEVAIYAARLTPEDIFSHFLTGIARREIPGSAPALVKLNIKDTLNRNRDHFEYGIDDQYNPLAPTPVLVDAPADVTTSTFAGASAARPGAYSVTGSETNVVRATLYNVPVALCSFTTAAINKTRVKGRVYGTGEATIYVRLGWRIGEGEFSYNEWQKLSSVNQFYELDFGVINAPPVEVGTQSVEGWIEAYATTSGAQLDLDTLYLMPLAAYGKSSTVTSTAISAAPVLFDDFSTQAAGALNGKAVQSGGTYTDNKVGTSATEWQVDTTNDLISLKSVNPDSGVHRVITASSPEKISSVVLKWDSKHTYNNNSTQTYLGAVARWVANGYYVAPMFSRWGSSNEQQLQIVKAKFGSTTSLGMTSQSSAIHPANQWWSYSFAIDEAGNFALQAGPRGGTLQTYIEGQDADLATGGILATGKVGIYGLLYAFSTSTESAAYVDNFAAFSLAGSKHVINAGKQLELTSSALRKEPASGSVWTPETLEGSYPKVEPNRMSRIVVKSRLTNVDEYPDSMTTNAAPLHRNSQKTSGTGTTTKAITLTKPTGVQPGDLLLATIAYSSTSAPLGIAAAEPTWTQIAGAHPLYTFYKVAGEAEPASYEFAATGTGTVIVTGGISAYAGVDQAAPISITGTVASSGTSLVAPSITLPTTSLLVVSIGAAAGSSPTVTTPPAPFQTAYTQAAGSGAVFVNGGSYYEPYSFLPGATGTRTFTLNASATASAAHSIGLALAKPLDGFKASLSVIPRVQLVA